MQTSTVLDKITEVSGPIAELVCLDIEATCWADGDPRNPGSDQYEMIELGMVVVDVQTLTITRELSILVKPIEHPVLTDFCVGLTTITNDLLDGKIPADPNCRYQTIHAADFGEAMKAAKTWLEPLTNYAWCSWGFYDLHQMTAEAKRKGAEMVFPADRHFNAKMIYQKTRTGVKRRGLGAAVKRQKLPFDGTHHRGVDDARNVARVILSDQGVAFDPAP